jgi:hypothetical protein
MRLVSSGSYISFKRSMFASRTSGYGWATLVDDAVGFSIGIPTKLVQLEAPKSSDSGWWYNTAGTMGYSIGVTPMMDPCPNTNAYYLALLEPKDGRNVTYHARKDDWFVIAGEYGDRSFYSRAQCRGRTLVTVIANLSKSQAETMWFLFVAISNSLSLRPVVNASAQPAPRLAFPSAAPGYPSAPISIVTSPTPLPPSAPTPSMSSLAAAIDRSGKTNAIRLALSDGTELRARDIFDRVSDAVFIVQSQDRQGSAVAIPARCNYVDAQGCPEPELRYRGRRVREIGKELTAKARLRPIPHRSPSLVPCRGCGAWDPLFHWT